MSISLNPEQQLAIDHLEGACIVTACPGSGKTRVITSRVINLIHNHNIAPKNILCLTFTNKAANEMKERVAAQLGNIIANQVWISTFHSICLAMLRKYGSEVGVNSGFSIYGDKDQKDLLQKVARMRGCEDINKSKISYMAKIVNNFREDIDNFDRCLDFLLPSHVEVLKEYLELLDDFNAVDFSGILYKTWQLLTNNQRVVDVMRNRFKYMMIDEGQDTNTIQYEIIKYIGGHGNIFIVGDYNQSIYGFRGAKPENLQLINKDFSNVKEIILPRNYRSSSQILSIAQKLIRNNSGASEVELHSEVGDGYDVVIDAFNRPIHESDVISRRIQLIQEDTGWRWRDFAILYRMSSQSQPIEASLRHRNIPYKVRGGFSFFDRKEVKTTLAYLSFLSNPNDTIAFARIISQPARKISKITVGKIERMCQSQKISILDACKKIDEIPQVTTIAKENLDSFITITVRHQQMERDGMNAAQISESYIKEVGYYQYIQNESEKDDISKRRIDNVDALLSGITDFSKQKADATIADYLHSIYSISTDNDSDDDSVILSTIHSVKGLEFPVVFIVGVEEGIIPHKLSRTKKDIEEERRLMYVAITRCSTRLFISHCRGRMNFARNQTEKRTITCCRSTFLDEIMEA